MVDFLIWVIIGELLFLFFNLPHQLFSFFILTCHNIWNTQVGQHNSTDFQDVVIMFFDYGLIKTYGFFVLFSCMNRTWATFSFHTSWSLQNLPDGGRSFLPLGNFQGSSRFWPGPLNTGMYFSRVSSYSFAFLIASSSLLCLASALVWWVSWAVQSASSAIGQCLTKVSPPQELSASDHGIQEVIEIRCEELVSQMGILCQDICCQVKILIFTVVEQQQVAKGLWRKGDLLSKTVVFSNPSVGLASMFISAWLCRVTGLTPSALGGMSVRVSGPPGIVSSVGILWQPWGWRLPPEQSGEGLRCCQHFEHQCLQWSRLHPALGAGGYHVQ